jgi:hypothetical protein
VPLDYFQNNFLSHDSVQSSKLLLALANTVILGIGPRGTYDQLAVGPHYIFSARIAQKTPLPTVFHFCVLHSRYLAVTVSLAPQFLL